MFLNNRVIHKDNTVLTDVSAILSDPHVGERALSVVAAEDALYLGSDMPFNHRFLMVQKKNTVAGSISISVWDGDEFVACEDVQDFTSVDGVPFARSGMIRFSLPQNTGWGKVYDSSEIDAAGDDLSSLKSKARYWIKVTFSAAFDFELRYVGFAFARDLDLNTYYPQLNTERVMTAFNKGVPMNNWERLHVLAAEEIIRDLRKDEIVFSPNQVLNPETFTDAACHKLAEMAYSPGALANEGIVEFAQGKYKQAMAKMVFDVDTDGDGRLDEEEKKAGWRLKRV